MKTIAWTLILVSTLVSCSRTKTAESVTQETPQIELSEADANEFAQNDILSETPPDSETDPSVMASPEDPLATTPATEQVAALENEAEAAVAESTTASESAPVILAEPSAEQPIAMTEGVGEYLVQKNETLMMIAFKLYGDYDKWRDIASRNSEKLKNGRVIAGTKLSYAIPAQAFEWSPKGNPYLIKTGDSLGKISHNVYQTPKKWKSIWNNNRPLIKDPNRIFAGFTLYWLDLDQIALNTSQGQALEL